MRTTAARLLLAAWALLLLDMTLRWYPEPNPPVNLRPFASIRHDLRVRNGHAFVNLAGNVLAFMPLGWLLPRALGRPTPAWRVALVALTFSGSIELAQLASRRRICDVDDVLLNVSGALAGHALAAVAPRRGGRRPRGVPVSASSVARGPADRSG